MTLLVERDVAHALAERRQQLALLEVVGNHVLAGLREPRLDHDVVERDRGGELRLRAVGTQLVGHRVEAIEDLAKARRELGANGVERGRGRPRADAADLLHKALEEDRVSSLIDLLGGEEVLLLLARSRIDVRREIVGDGVLAPEEERVVPQCGRAFEVRELLAPLARVLLKSSSIALQLLRSQRAYRSS